MYIYIHDIMQVIRLALGGNISYLIQIRNTSSLKELDHEVDDLS